MNTEEETENLKEMLEIAVKYHSQLQSEPLMSKHRESAIEDILRGVTRKLNGEEPSNVEKSISSKGVNRMTGKAATGKPLARAESQTNSGEQK